MPGTGMNSLRDTGPRMGEVFYATEHSPITKGTKVKVAGVEAHRITLGFEDVVQGVHENGAIGDMETTSYLSVQRSQFAKQYTKEK